MFTRYLEWLYFRLEDFILICAKYLPDPWLEWVNAAILVNESINSTSLKGMVCVPTGFVFVFGVYLSPWTYECLDDWCKARQCLLGYLTVPLVFHKWFKTPHWSNSWIYIFELQRACQGEWLRICFLWQSHTSLVRSKCKWECVQKNLFNS